MNDKGCIAQRFFLVFRCDDQLDLMTENDSNNNNKYRFYKYDWWPVYADGGLIWLHFLSFMPAIQLGGNEEYL